MDMRQLNRKNNEKCWCGSENFHVRIGTICQGKSAEKNYVYLVCVCCDAKRRVSTPGASCDYAIEPVFDGWELIDVNEGNYKRVAMREKQGSIAK